MKANTSMQGEQDQAGLFSRMAHDVSVALDWLTGPALTDQERRERLMAEVQNLKHDSSAPHLP